jgi:hypothetical protein
VHYWYVIVINSGDGPITSAPVEGWAQDAIAAPDPPANFSASDGVYFDQVALTWDESAGATLYHVWRSSTAGSGHVEIDTTPINSYSDFSPLSGTGYYYVTAENANGTSAPSNEDSGFVSIVSVPPILLLNSPPAQGSGSAADPYVVPPSTDWAFTLIDPNDGDVTGSGTYSTSDIAEVYVQGSWLHVDNTPADDFTFKGSYNGQDSNTIYFHLLKGGSPPTLSIDNPPFNGNGTLADPYITPPDADFDFTLTDPINGEVTADASYTASDPNIEIINSTLLVGSNPPADFDFYGTYNGQDSNRIYFHVQGSTAGITIYPATIDPNWFGVTGSGTQFDPFKMHDGTFNPDSDMDGTCDMQFWLWAEDLDGNQLDNETLEWYYVPANTPDMVTDINSIGSKGKFHVRLPLDPVEDGYLYASDGINESNYLYIESWLF